MFEKISFFGKSIQIRQVPFTSGTSKVNHPRLSCGRRWMMSGKRRKKEYCKKLFASMPDRLAAVIKSKVGEYTRF